MTYLAKAFQDPDFLERFEKTIDPWGRSRMVGEKVHELRISFRTLTPEQRAELAKEGEVELRAGLELMGKDKKTIQDLISLVDPPTTQ